MALTGHLSDLSLSELIEFSAINERAAVLKFCIRRVRAIFICKAARWLTRTSACCTASTLFTTRSRFRTRSLNSVLTR